MELLWTCQDLDQVDTLIRALPTVEDQRDAQSLVDIAVWESIESECGLADYEQAAKNIIATASRK